MSARAPSILVFMTDHQRGATVFPEHPAVRPNAGRLARDEEDEATCASITAFLASSGQAEAFAGD